MCSRMLFCALMGATVGRSVILFASTGSITMGSQMLFCALMGTTTMGRTMTILFCASMGSNSTMGSQMIFCTHNAWLDCYYFVLPQWVDCYCSVVPPWLHCYCFVLPPWVVQCYFAHQRDPQVL